MSDYIESIYKLAEKEQMPTSRICTICGKWEYPQSDKATTMTWLCPECAKKIGKLIGGENRIMSDYISREAAFDSVFHQFCAGSDETESALNAAIDEIKTIPAADVWPVITCGECKHWFENGTDYCSCDRDALLRERDFFCAAGEKREES